MRSWGAHLRTFRTGVSLPRYSGFFLPKIHIWASKRSSLYRPRAADGTGHGFTQGCLALPEILPMHPHPRVLLPQKLTSADDQG